MIQWDWNSVNLFFKNVSLMKYNWLLLHIPQTYTYKHSHMQKMHIPLPPTQHTQWEDNLVMHTVKRRSHPILARPWPSFILIAIEIVGNSVPARRTLVRSLHLNWIPI